MRILSWQGVGEPGGGAVPDADLDGDDARAMDPQRNQAVVSLGDPRRQVALHPPPPGMPPENRNAS